ncbi:hypothetical protein PM724_01585 [Erysipelatoclostridium ramosum]|uniref:hypothetical protein n=1 Tax=Thomasclavelia ramosa TaxID=1547 RepID=UPI0018AB9C35|nr:hypothetical protein [Thomasclavelia ramosa]MDB7092615.1 hypothetical protein [Thomasclavelia ramosa]QQY26948.1 hypothetical protein I6I63_12840 [Thomasclavelia ramosa]
MIETTSVNLWDYIIGFSIILMVPLIILTVFYMIYLIINIIEKKLQENNENRMYLVALILGFIFLIIECLLCKGLVDLFQIFCT